MRRLAADETYKPIRIGDYVSDCLRKFDAPVAQDQLEIQHVYLNGDKSFYHVLIHYGLHNRFLVIVVDCSREVVHGHYLLDLKQWFTTQGAMRAWAAGRSGLGLPP